MNRVVVVAALVTLTSPAFAQSAQKLTMAEAVDVAMRQNPAVRQSQAAFTAAQGRVDLAKVPLHPTVSVSASVTEGSRRSGPCATDMTMTCGGFFDPTASTGLAAQANWRIWDFGQTAANVRAAEANAAAVQAGLGTTSLDIRRNVEVAYLEAVARQRLVTVAESTVKSEELHLDQAKRFVAAQAKDPIEVAQAQSRAANAHASLAQAQSNAAVALANLRAAIGWVDPTTAPAIDPNWQVPTQSEPAPLGTLVQEARKFRPELVAADKQIEAAQASVDAAHAERRPVLAATAQTQWNPAQDDWAPQPSWAAGLTLSWQLWDGGRSRADVKVAQANLINAEAERDALLVTLTSALESARAEIVANRAAVDASNEAVTAAQAQLKLADARYTQGLGSQIELADAQQAVTTAQGNLISAEWQLASAWAGLYRALGGEH
jgi:outer membrane protein